MKNIAKSAIEFLSILPTKCCIPPRRILKKEDKSGLLINGILVLIIIKILLYIMLCKRSVGQKKI